MHCYRPADADNFLKVSLLECVTRLAEENVSPSTLTLAECNYEYGPCDSAVYLECSEATYLLVATPQSFFVVAGNTSAAIGKKCFKHPHACLLTYNMFLGIALGGAWDHNNIMRPLLTLYCT